MKLVRSQLEKIAMRFPRSLNAEWCATVILTWHIEHGLKVASHRLSREGFDRYQQALKQFQQCDLCEPSEQLKVVNAQRSGVFEWAYTIEIPKELLHRFRSELMLVPRNLGCAACIGWDELKDTLENQKSAESD